MRPATFRLHSGATGFDMVEVNGQDVTDLVDGASVLYQQAGPPLVRLALKAGVDVEEIAGEGVVEVQPAGGGTDLGRWLDAIDAGELERIVLERSQLSTMSSSGSPIAIALVVLREWAAGR